MTWTAVAWVLRKPWVVAQPELGRVPTCCWKARWAESALELESAGLVWSQVQSRLALYSGQAHTFEMHLQWSLA